MELEIPHQEVVRHIGGETNERIEHKIEEWSQEAGSMINPEVAYTHCPVDELDSLQSYKIEKIMNDCDQVVLFIATLGQEIDEHIRMLTDEDRYVDAYILDAIGSAGAETLVQDFHEGFEEHFQEHDRGVTLRFSPGYCDWPLEDQELIFDSVNTNSIDVELTDSYVMTPSKSVSGLFGVTEQPCDSVTDHNPCLTCSNTGCNMRRVDEE